jgi:death-on-curing protein
MSLESFEYLTVADVLAIHEVIVESSDETTPGVSSEGDVEYALERVESGHFGQRPESLHEKGFQLLRLLVANHPFVDGNKRTALAATVAFYALNGYDLDYDDEIRTILKRFGTDEASVAGTEVVQYLRDCTSPLPSEYGDTYRFLLSVADSALDASEQNDYDGEERT